MLSSKLGKLKKYVMQQNMLSSKLRGANNKFPDFLGMGI